MGALLLLAATLTFHPGPSTAGAANFEFTPCTKPSGPTKIGNAELTTARATWKKLNRAGLSQRFLAPTRRDGVVPVFPVSSGTDSGGTVSAGLSGGFAIGPNSKRELKAFPSRFVRRSDGTAWVSGRAGGREIRLFRVRGTRVERSSGTVTGLEVLGGRTELSGGFAKELRKRAGLGQARAGMGWGRLYLDWTNPVEPDVTPPAAPADFPRPVGATELAGGSITWNVRPSWVEYVASGDPPSAIAPAVPGPSISQPGEPPLTYSFTFPFTSGWVEDGPGGVSKASVKGDGGVYFRYCGTDTSFKGINFSVRSAEVELAGTSSRLVFTVQGIDGTPFERGRAIVLDLRPEGVTPANSGSRTSWNGIPGFVASGSTGVFGGFYSPGTEFGSVDLTINRDP